VGRGFNSLAFKTSLSASPKSECSHRVTVLGEGKLVPGGISILITVMTTPSLSTLNSHGIIILFVLKNNLVEQILSAPKPNMRNEAQMKNNLSPVTEQNVTRLRLQKSESGN
jgi:hypothetical protein